MRGGRDEAWLRALKVWMASRGGLAGGSLDIMLLMKVDKKR